MAIGAHLSRLDALVEELKDNFEAKEAEAIEKTGRYIAECEMDLVSDANSIIVLDCLVAQSKALMLGKNDNGKKGILRETSPFTLIYISAVEKHLNKG